MLYLLSQHCCCIVYALFGSADSEVVFETHIFVCRCCHNWSDMFRYA